MSFVLVRDRSRLGHKPDYRHEWSPEYVRKSMYAYAAVCLLRAGQPRSAGDAAKLGQFVGQFSWVTGDPIVLKGISNVNSHLYFTSLFPFLKHYFMVWFVIMWVINIFEVDFGAKSNPGAGLLGRNHIPVLGQNQIPIFVANSNPCSRAKSNPGFTAIYTSIRA